MYYVSIVRMGKKSVLATLRAFGRDLFLYLMLHQHWVPGMTELLTWIRCPSSTTAKNHRGHLLSKAGLCAFLAVCNRQLQTGGKELLGREEKAGWGWTSQLN
jgi:hypothetical protein